MMWSRLSKNSDPKRILVFSMTNIGDVVLSCPVIDILQRDFPNAKMDVMVGPKAVSLFEANPHFNVKMFDKRAPLVDKRKWFLDLYAEHYDCVIDLRHTMLPFFLLPRFATPVLLKNNFKGHKGQAHLNRLRQVYDFEAVAQRKWAVVTTREDEAFFAKEVAPFVQAQDFVVIAPGAADTAKRWHAGGFAAVADYLSEKFKVVFVGDAKDGTIVDDIRRRMKAPCLSLAGKINLRCLSFVLSRCAWALTHDSGVMHVASYFNVPLVVLWGPTSLEKYGPWSQKAVVVRRNEHCMRCHDHKLKVTHTCMSSIQVDDVIKAIHELP